MAWISSTFEDCLENFKPTKRRKFSTGSGSVKPSKKHCTNLWVDEFPPLSSDELSVHKKKIQEVQLWLKESSSKVKGRKVLLLTGPPGSAKSTVIRILSKENNLNLREWTNPSISKSFSSFKELGPDNFSDRFIYDTANETDRFNEFLFRSSKYKDICSVGKSSGSLLLIEEVPNMFIMNPYLLHDSIRKYSHVCSTPVVFVISDCNKDTIAKSLFPSELQEELSIINIVFNPISPSLLLNGLNRILNLTNNTNSSFFDSISIPKKQFLQRVAEKSGGDIRSAINSLQFEIMRGAGSEKKGERCRSLKKSSSKDDFVGCKDSSLILFRALGKILYCKREGTIKDSPSLPPFLREHERRPLLEDPEDVFERSASDTSSFNLFLHHNCLPFFSRVEDFSAALEYLGDADIISSYWDPSDQLQRYGSSVSIRGMMHSLNEGKKEGQIFRSLTRPTWYNFLQVTKDRNQRFKSLNKESFFTKQELFSIYVPLISKVFLSSSAEADGFIRDVGLMYPIAPVKTNPQAPRPSVVHSSFLGSGFDDDEELTIEEFED